MNGQSIADRFIMVMGELQKLEVSNDRPERHAVRAAKRAAEAILGDAINRAMDCVYVAQSAADAVREVQATERAAKGSA